jgi:arabinofuranosyltransferase
MNRNSRHSWWLGAGLLIVIALLLLGVFLNTERRITGGIIGVPLDDAWIHFQFARNLSQGAGFSYNPGQPTPGSTAPLWTVMLAGIGLLTDDFLLPALVLSALFFLTCILLAFGFTGWVTGKLYAALLAGLAVALSGRLLWAGLAGMETTAFAALSLAAIWAYSKYGLRLLPALLFALASQLRPEGHALFALAVVDAAWNWIRVDHKVNSAGWREGFLEFLPPLALYVLISLPYVLFSLATTGKPLPNTFYAKVGSQYLFSLRTLRETVAWHWQDNPISIVLVLFGIWPLWRRSRLAVIWLLALPLLTAVVIDQTWHHGRYTIPLIPLQMSAAAVGASWLVGKLPAVDSASFPYRPAAIAGLCLLLIFGGAVRLSHWAEMLGTNTREIEDIDVALGRWLAANAPPDALIAIDDIGAIAYHSRRQILDMNGLVSPEVWPAITAPDQLQKDQRMTRILSELGPQYMAAFPLWRWNIVSNPDVARPIHHVHTGTHTIIFQQDAYVYETEWPFVEAPSPQHRQTAVFGEAVSLLGYDLDLSDELELVFYWQSLAGLSADYDVFIHITDDAGRIVAQADRQPLSGLAPTSSWEVGDIIRDPYTISLPPELPPGSYDVMVGFFQRDTGERLPVSAPSARDNAFGLEPVNIPQR